MSPTSTLQVIPRTTVRLSVAAARLPLTATEMVTGHQGDEEWPPTLAFEGFEAQVKELAGTLLRDPVLSDEGRLLRAKVDRLRQAVTLETEAEQRRQAAEAEFSGRVDDAQQTKEEAARAEQERKAQIAGDEAEAKRKADTEARQRAEQARQAEEEADKAAAAKARRSRSEALGAEEQALAKEKAAAARSADAQKADTAAKVNKAVRKNSR